jgi:hypothetical protein
VAKKENYIELNGKRYDARSGAVLSGDAAHSRGHQSVDGMVRPSAHAVHAPRTHVASRTRVEAPKPAVHKPVMDVRRPAAHKPAHKPAHHLTHHTAKKSETLMRSAVHKPEPSIRRKAKATSHTHALVAQPKFQIIKKLSHPSVDKKRVKRSSLIARSEYIRRFANPTELPKPKAHAAAIPASQFKPVHADAPAVHAVSMPQASSLDVFERALQTANSHMELPLEHKTTKRHKARKAKRAFGIAAASLAVLVIGGFVALQNQANLTIKYASSKAGFAATLPHYKPSGFAASKFTYSPGVVGVKYTNTSEHESFSLVQKQSGWDSTALHDNFVALNNSSYQTFQSAGRTIYTYGKGSATWVNAGVWYQVTSDGSLKTTDLINLANSM